MHLILTTITYCAKHIKRRYYKPIQPENEEEVVEMEEREELEEDI